MKLIDNPQFAKQFEAWQVLAPAISTYSSENVIAHIARAVWKTDEAAHTALEEVYEGFHRDSAVIKTKCNFDDTPRNEITFEDWDISVEFDPYISKSDNLAAANKLLLEWETRLKNHGFILEGSTKWEKEGTMHGSNPMTRLFKTFKANKIIEGDYSWPVQINYTVCYTRPGFPTPHCKVETHTYTSVSCSL